MTMIIRNSLFFAFFTALISVSDCLRVCSKSEDCKAMDAEAVCFQSQCICPFMKVYSLAEQKCLNAVPPAGKCVDSIQCDQMSSGGVCVNAVCACPIGQTYVAGQCRKLNYLDEPCKQSSDCYFGYDRISVTCKDNVCQCAADYYRRHSTICRKQSNIDESCLVHADCTDKSSKCEEKKCVKIEESPSSSNEVEAKEFREPNSFSNKSIAHTNFEDSNKLGDECSNHGAECNGLVNSVCLSHCYCKNGYYASSDRTQCIAEVGEFAKSEADCGKAKNVFYDAALNMCLCNKDFLVEENLRSCKKSISFKASCTFDGQCSPYNAFCRSDRPRVCTCKASSEFNETAQLCVDKTGIGGSCDPRDMCDIENTECSPEKVCVCKENFYQLEDKCVPGIDGPCKSDSDCKIENTVCNQKDESDTKTCNCAQNYTTIENKCFKLVEELKGECNHTQQCKLQNTVCRENKCECNVGRHFAYGECHVTKSLGDLCSSLGECSTMGAGVECRNSKCKCKLKYHASEDGTKCINAAPSMRLSYLTAAVIPLLVLFRFYA